MNSVPAPNAVPRPRVTVYFSEEVYKYLNDRAEKELRTVGNLVEYLVTRFVEEERAKQDSSEKQS